MNGRRRWLGWTATFAALISFQATAFAAAQETVLQVDWSVSPPASGEVVGKNVRVTSDGAGGQLPLIAFDVPDLGRQGYVLHGQVRYADVVGAGYLEMWNVFADGSRFFSRTLGTEGTMAALTGSSDWRPFELPFFLEGAAPPSRLEINVVLPGSGTVEVGPLQLVRLPESGSGSWIPDRSIGLVGAVLGSAIGLLGALVATLVARSRGRRVVLPAMTVAAIAGVALIVASIVAIPSGQPPSVVFLLLLPGAILAAAFGLGLPRVRRAYAEAELRKMRAMDHA